MLITTADGELVTTTTNQLVVTHPTAPVPDTTGVFDAAVFDPAVFDAA